MKDYHQGQSIGLRVDPELFALLRRHGWAKVRVILARAMRRPDLGKVGKRGPRPGKANKRGRPKIKQPVRNR